MAKDTVKRTVRCRLFVWREEVGEDPRTGRPRFTQHNARRGDKIELSSEEAERGDAVHAFFTNDDEKKEQERVEAEPDFRTDSVDELALWIEEQEPTVQDLLDATEGDPDIAKKLLEAEEAAEGEPRVTAVEGLNAIISRGAQ